MTYPTIDREVQIKQEKADRAYREAEIYIDADSFEEFELKRSIAGINYKFFLNDAFKIYYFVKDKYRALYKNEDNICACLMMLAVLSILATILFGYLIVLSVTVLSGIMLFFYLKTMSKYRFASNMIDKVSEDRKSKSSKTSASIPLSSVVCVGTYVTSSYGSLSC